MEQMDAIMLIAFSLLAVLSLLIVVLQKKGMIHSQIVQTSHSFDFINGGKVTFLMALLGAVVMLVYKCGHEEFNTVQYK